MLNLRSGLLALWCIFDLLYSKPIFGLPLDAIRCDEPGLLVQQLFEGSVYGRQGYSAPVGPFLTVEIFAVRGDWHLAVLNRARKVLRMTDLEGSGEAGIAKDSIPLRPQTRFSFARISKRTQGDQTMIEPAVMPNPGDFGRGFLQIEELASTQPKDGESSQVIYMQFNGCIAWQSAQNPP